MEFKFKREIAETLGLNTAVLLEYITNSELQKCKIEFLLKELSFWDENELMSLLIDLNVRGLIDLDTEKKLVSLTKGQPKTKLQTPKKIKRKSKGTLKETLKNNYKFKFSNSKESQTKIKNQK